ncbi:MULTISPECIES: FAD-dependent oxidoreductase [unclassified Rhodococcus (in: high G+C Gram-positive bacteria)]|uniref:NAD(P)/FAD-dependent oxidoreductase n=1 Tax=Rhodococcus sp. SJ-3 TaxID=3454628 RepID=UPI003F78F611
MAESTVIVGASLAGVRTASDLRKEGYNGSITLIGDESEKPYDRPPLSKGFLSGKDSAESISLCSDSDLRDQEIDLVLGTSALSVDTDRRIVTLDSGDSLHYDSLVAATGAGCIRPPWYRQLAGVHELRTLADAEALRKTLLGTGSLVVIGGGFVGTEVAATARALGVSVTMVLRESHLLATALSSEVGSAVTALHERNGVDVRPCSDVEALVGEHAVAGVRLADGTTVSADAVLVAVGVRPHVEWLRSTDMYDRRGVAVSPQGRAGAHLWAAGDVVQNSNGHWAAALAHAKAVARDIVGKPALPVALPDYFWSDQYTHKLQVLGHTGPESTLTPVHGSLAAMNFVGAFGSADKISGALLIDQPKHLGRMRQLVSAEASVATCRDKTM